MTVFASDATAVGKILNDWEIAIEKGDRAPFDGVLVPEDSYRFYQIDSELYTDCKSRLEASVGLCPDCDPWFTNRQFLFLATGIALGFAASQNIR